MKTQSMRFSYAFLVLVLASLACSAIAPAEPTVTPEPSATNTSLPTPTETKRPTRTPLPTRTPNVEATQIYNDLFSKVEQFASDGLIPSTSGEYIELDPYSEDFAQIGWLRYRYFDDVEVEHFVFNAHVEWETAMDTSDVSGCGVVFGVIEGSSSNEYYGVVFDKSRIYFTIARSGYYYELGKTRGTGRLNFGNPAEADVTIVVYNNHAYVYVDDDFIGEYTLSQDKELKGYFGFGIISGTNKDYGTSCDITNPRIWSLDS
jgi:hypothetical protein